jgi:F-type H+-transporting ATPase subunit alpha
VRASRPDQRSDDNVSQRHLKSARLIKERIKRYEAAAEARNVGTITLLTDGIVRIHGLADARYGEMLEFPGDTVRASRSTSSRTPSAPVVLGDYQHLSEGRHRQDDGAHPRGAGRAKALLGRVVDSLGRPVDGKGPIATTMKLADREGRARRHHAQVR